MNRVVTLTEEDVAELQVILMDRDGAAALEFLRERVAKPLERSARKALDVSRGRP
ncbi:MAG: hypothetical protein ACYDA8_08970 [Deferrisomatales bacterium]